MQLFLFLFFNLLLKIFPAELCWISPIALCDGWCISGYGNLNCFLKYFFFPWAFLDALSLFPPSFGEMICFGIDGINKLNVSVVTDQGIFILLK